MGAMEAAFAYAYACIEDWDGYAFHSNNLVMYYEDIMKCDVDPLLPDFSFLGSISTRLPGFGTLTNINGDAIPHNQVLLFYQLLLYDQVHLLFPVLQELRYILNSAYLL